jgi:hypothetical protein
MALSTDIVMKQHRHNIAPTAIAGRSHSHFLEGASLLAIRLALSFNGTTMIVSGGSAIVQQRNNLDR